MPSTPHEGEPATKGDLLALEERFEQRFAHFEDKLIEAMRDMQTELLRGFAAHNAGLTVRMRKLEADQNNLDASMSPRLAQLEQQVTEMNIRLIALESERLSGQ